MLVLENWQRLGVCEWDDGKRGMGLMIYGRAGIVSDGRIL